MSEVTQAGQEVAVKAKKAVEPLDAELTAMKRILKELKSVPAGAPRQRVIAWAASRAESVESQGNGLGNSSDHHAALS